MASSKEFVEYVAEQLRCAGTISCRQMFGEYGWYCDGKFLGVICDDQLFIMAIFQKKIPPASSAPQWEQQRDIVSHRLRTECNPLLFLLGSYSARLR